MLWLYLLGAVTVLTIVLRRVLRRQRPLYDELYSTRVAIEHVHSGVAWVQANGKIGFANESLTNLTGAEEGDLAGNDWYGLFPSSEHDRIREAYTQMLLAGIASLDTVIEHPEDGRVTVNLRLVAVSDHKARLMGHHAMIHDISRERALEDQLHSLSDALGTKEIPAPETAGLM